MTRFYDEAGYEIPRKSMLIELDEPADQVTYRDTTPIDPDTPLGRAIRGAEELRARQRVAS